MTWNPNLPQHRCIYSCPECESWQLDASLYETTWVVEGVIQAHYRAEHPEAYRRWREENSQAYQRWQESSPCAEVHVVPDGMVCTVHNDTSSTAVNRV